MENGVPDEIIALANNLSNSFYKKVKYNFLGILIFYS